MTTQEHAARLYPKATDEEVREWAARHDLGISSMTNLRDAFEDAQTFPFGVVLLVKEQSNG